MNPEQFEEALRLRAEGYTVLQTAAALGASPGVLSGMLFRHRKGAQSRLLTDEQVAEAIYRHDGGETWQAIADSMGAGRTTLLLRVRKREGITWSRREHDRGAYTAGIIEPHVTRTPRRIIKPPEEVNALARKFASGEITRAEFVYSIGAGA